jgi:mannose-6-phosphate isomerase-like protein (cupin superfamily)
MHIHQLTGIMEQLTTGGERYLEFIRSHDLSVGVYHLTAGSLDPQQPHTEDEVYFVVRGAGHFQMAGESRAVMSGSVIYVPALVEHRFHTITDDLTILVFFAPAEGVNAHPRASHAG